MRAGLSVFVATLCLLAAPEWSDARGPKLQSEERLFHLASCPAGQRLVAGNYCIPNDAVDCGGGGYCPNGNTCGSKDSCVPPGYIDCGTGQSCPPGNVCRPSGCLPEGHTDCGNGVACRPGFTCGSMGSCVPAGYVDCGDGTTCRSTHICEKGVGCIPKVSRRVCFDMKNFCPPGQTCSGGSCYEDLTILWRRLPTMSAGATCKDLGGIEIGTQKHVHWRLITSRTMAPFGVSPREKESGGMYCACHWRAVHEVTTTSCRRIIDEEATIDGRVFRRQRAILDEIKQHQSVIANDAVTSGMSISAGTQDCTCMPPEGGRIAK